MLCQICMNFSIGVLYKCSAFRVMDGILLISIWTGATMYETVMTKLSTTISVMISGSVTTSQYFGFSQITDKILLSIN